MRALLLFTFSLVLAFTLSESADSTVLDTDGNKVRVGAKYYVLPAVRGLGGGATLIPGSTSCSYDIVLEQLEVSNGTPVTFAPVVGKGRTALTVSLSADTNIMVSASYIMSDPGTPVTFSPVVDKGKTASTTSFSADTSIMASDSDIMSDPGPGNSCPSSYAWELGSFVVAGTIASGGYGTWFKIVKLTDFYSLQWCPSCITCKFVCRNIGISIDSNGRRKLAVSNDPFLIKFKKV